VALDSPAALRQAVASEIRFGTQPEVSQRQLTIGLNLREDLVDRENDGTIVLRVEPTPELIARLTGWLAAQNVLLTELRAGSRTLEQAFLTLTSSTEITQP